MSDSPSLAILLCTYNGEAHLAEQLASILGQDASNLSIYASDDGSSDGTVDILARYSEATSVPIYIRQGARVRHTANFLSLVTDASIQASYFAYADQDDYWDPDKLSRALSQLERVPPSVPALYCGRTRSVAKNGTHLGLSPRFTRPPCFQNALIQNIGGGNTMVFNKAARQLLLAAGPADVATHDWWTYLLVSGAGGEVIYDPEPALSYRQHEGNEVGANLSMRDRIRRYLGAMAGRNREWGDRNIDALQACRQLLTPENQACLNAFSAARNAGLVERIRGMRHSGVHAQTVTGNVGLIAAILLKKI